MKTRIHMLLGLCLLLAGAMPSSANIFLQIPGIPGESTVSGFQNQINLTSFTQGIAAGAQAGHPVASEITITKLLDKSSPPLFLNCAQGTVLTNVVLSFTTTTMQGTLQIYYQITLDNVVIKSVSNSSGGDRPAETITLAFTKIHWRYTGSGTVESGWDFTANTTF